MLPQRSHTTRRRIGRRNVRALVRVWLSGLAALSASSNSLAIDVADIEPLVKLTETSKDAAKSVNRRRRRA